MSKKILLACAGGFSTSMLVTRMIESMESKGLDFEILAVSEHDVANHLDSSILLLGPQISHREEDFRETLDFPVVTIDQFDYGTMNGGKVLDNAIKIIEGDSK